ncbi:histidinol phosphate phosphatase H [Nadsonia fulvescens var. elongata DSM 6958]|uniref:Histidinol-phosphatase n=1 Tax=Nadsonia fulvescens var. elongata DSM 6958 TaxID=857566 RepID=A0A1E3PEJ9_9ASCO|nr:histidinol phosphate phosphatase H [Nadsonia fulvescens var. elongata DSM 6958]
MHSHHSHSGQYVQHAKDTLDQVVNRAIDMGFKQFCLTEHIPRDKETELYPEEIESATSPADLLVTFQAYVQHAKALQLEHKDKIELLVGFETETITPKYLEYCREMMQDQQYGGFDLLVGSVHHVFGIPIDFDLPSWNKAMDKAVELNGIGPSKEHALVEAYYDLQYEMLNALKPTVIGHFDLIMLLAPKDIQEKNLESEWPIVWEKIIRNIKLVSSYGGLFELSSAAVRKGWPSPYPRENIARAIISSGGKFCLSDDSHGVDQVGLNYQVSLKYLQQLKVNELWALHKDPQSGKVDPVAIPLDEVAKDPFWNQYEGL